MNLHQTSKCIDSSKLDTYLNCPRKFFYKYVLGWNPVGGNVHLVFGQAWHKAMEVLYSEGMNNEGVEKACHEFISHYRAYFPSPLDDEANKPKNIENALRGIIQYANTYKNTDRFNVVFREVSSSLYLDEDDEYEIAFNIDLICEQEDIGLFVMDHKTTSRFDSNWRFNFETCNQVNCYIFALYMFYSDEFPIYGMIINGACIRNAPRLKKDGTIYASDKDNEFDRFHITKSLKDLEEWRLHTIEHMDRIDYDFAELNNSGCEKGDVLIPFPKNTNHCVNKYGRCELYDICHSMANPLRYECPPGFEVKFWDPKKREEVK